jgi:hypothetical protein
VTTVVDVGGGKGSRYAREFINEYLPKREALKFLRMDIDPDTDPDILQDITVPIPEKHYGKYDVVYASHVLEHVSFWSVMPVVTNLLSLLKVGGDLMIIVPNIEWAARQIMSGICDLSVMAVIWGSEESEWFYHKCGFTKNALALMAQTLELETSALVSTPLFVYINDKKYTASQHVLVAKKVKESEPMKVEVKRVFTKPDPIEL